MKWYKVPGITTTGQPFIKKIKLRSKTICLVNYDGELFGLSAGCPHAGGDLTQGWCKNSKLICPVHRYSYDLHTGKGSDPDKMILYTLILSKLKKMEFI